MSPRTGRPKIDNPKSISLKIRIDADTHQALLQYCKDNKLTKAAAVRQGIALILGKKNKAVSATPTKLSHLQPNATPKRC